MLRKHKSPKSDMKAPRHNLKSHMAIKTRKKMRYQTSRKMENKTKKIR